MGSGIDGAERLEPRDDTDVMFGRTSPEEHCDPSLHSHAKTSSRFAIGQPEPLFSGPEIIQRFVEKLATTRLYGGVKSGFFQGRAISVKCGHGLRPNWDRRPVSRLCETGPDVHYFQQFEIDGEKIAYWTLGDEAAERQIIWAHGWGQDHRAFEQLAESWAAGAFNILIDFPGFGASPRPRVDWGTAEYADACAVLLKQFPRCERIWVGHSFGCRVGIQLAARHGSLIDGLFLVAAAGLPRRRSGLSRLRVQSKIALYKSLRALPFGDKSRLRERFGSADYKAAGDMRGILTKVVNEDLSPQAREIACL